MFGDHFLSPDIAETSPEIKYAAKLGRKARAWLCKKKKTSFLAQESSFVNMIVCNADSLTCPRESVFAQNGGCNIRPFFGDANIGTKDGEDETVLETVQFNENGISVTFALSFIPENIANFIAQMVSKAAPMVLDSGHKKSGGWFTNMLKNLGDDVSASVTGGSGIGADAMKANTAGNGNGTGIAESVVAMSFAQNMDGISDMLQDFEINLSM